MCRTLLVKCGKYVVKCLCSCALCALLQALEPHISQMVAERGTRPPPDVDAPMPQMAEQLLEVPKIVSQDRILQQTVEQFVNHSEAKRADIAKGSSQRS